MIVILTRHWRGRIPTGSFASLRMTRRAVYVSAMVVIKMEKLTIKKQSGQSLVETLAAITVAVIVITALVSLGVVAMQSSNFAKNKSMAEKLATERMENARACRDQASSWGDFLTNCQVPQSPITGTIFTQKVEIRNLPVPPVPPNQRERAEVTVTVSWTDARGTHPIVITSYLSSWR